MDHEAAILHAAEINRDPGRPPICEPYWCRWGDDPREGPTAPVHWHVGKTSDMAKMLNPGTGPRRVIGR